MKASLNLFWVYLISFAVIASSVLSMPNDLPADFLADGRIEAGFRAWAGDTPFDEKAKNEVRSFKGAFLNAPTDEGGFLITGILLSDCLFVKKDTKDSLWQKCLNNYGSANPRIGLYMIGLLSRLAQNISLAVDKTLFLIILRLFLAILAAGCVTLFFCIIRITASARQAFFGAALLLVNPLFRSVQVAIYLEIIMCLFLFAALFYLARCDRALAAGKPVFAGMFASGIFAGIALSTKLFAFVFYPVFFFLLIRRRKEMTPREITGCIAMVLSTAVLIFLVSNPLLYSDFFAGIKAMTTAHIAAHQGASPLPNFAALKYLATYPFLMFQPLPPALNTRPALPTGIEQAFVAVGYILALAGLLKAKKDNGSLATAFFASCFVFFAFIVVSLPFSWMVPKAFLLPAVSVIWLAVYALG